MNLLGVVWRNRPDSRLGQLVVNVSGRSDPFYTEDNMLETALKSLVVEDATKKYPSLSKLSALPVQEYILYQGNITNVVLRRQPQRHGADKWSINTGNNVIDKALGQWILEPMPSNRTDEFIRDCRFDSAEEALAYWQSANIQPLFK